MKHTATPWRIGMKPGPMIYGPQDEWIADLRIETNIPNEDEWIAGPRIETNIPNENGHNATFIVRACNAHEDLLTACKNLLTVIVNEDVPQKVLDEAGMLHAAIRKAEEY
jgi:hypothetical protein